MTMNDRTEFTVAKETGTYADTLKAVGLATLLHELTSDDTDVTVGDAGANFVIRLSKPLPDTPNGARLSVGYQYLAHEKAKPAPASIRPDSFPYAGQRAVETVWRQWNDKRGKLRPRKSGASGEGIATAEPPRPDPRFSLFKALNSLRAGSESWNNVAHAVQRQLAADPDALAAYVNARLSYQDAPIPAIVVTALEKAKASVLQTFLPTAGKGINRNKPDSAKLDNLKGAWVDWFKEWCRYRGVGYVLSARFAGQGGKDLKFICLLPGTEINLGALRRLADELAEGRMFLAGRAYTNVKSDVFAVLELAEWLIGHSEYAPRPEERLVRFLRIIRPTQPRVRDLIAGVQLAYFKSLGTGKALINVSTVFLPDWLPVSANTYEQWRALLDEHKRILRTLDKQRPDDKEKAEEANLLLAYRDAISRNQLDLYLDFFADYGTHYMRTKSRGQYSEQFTQQNVEVLIMALSEDINPRIADLIKSAGFRSIANAVHEATIKAQYWKGQGQQDYDIHYGLAQKWKRAVDQGTEFFLHELADFVRAYNEENGKRQEKKQPTRDAVVQTDLDTILNTITTRDVDARTVCLLLLAYGYSMTANEKANAEAARANRAKRKATI
jgi:hypothetical protein